MPVPNHRPDCKTRLFKTTCPDCHKPVWYFDCTCGSKVFFDIPEPPWTKHADNCPMYLVRLMINDGGVPHLIRQLLERKTIAHNKPINKSVVEFLNYIETPGKKPKQIILPSRDAIEFNGILKEIQKINFFKRLNLQNNFINEKLLGKFARETYHELIVENNEANNNFISQWTCVISTSELGEILPKKK